jgi:hypothetical protein
MYKFKLVVLAGALAMGGSAQFTLSARTISGVIYSDSDSTSVVGASCRLFSGDNFIGGTATDGRGAFELDTDIKSKLRLEVSMTGFNTAEIMIDKSGDVKVGDVYITEGVALDEVTVTAGQMTESRGRTILFPSASDVKASSTAISLFQKLPFAGLQANPVNRTLTVDGGTPVILINGVPSTIDDFNALQPKDIARIEFLRMTPARYADSGKSGFINITLKERNDGGQIYAWGRSAVNTAFVDANIRASYHQGPSQFSLIYVPSWRNYQKVYDNTAESYIGDDFRVDIENHDRNPFNYTYHNVRLKYDFTRDVNTLFSATFSVTPSNSRRRVIARSHDTYFGDYDNYNRTESKDMAPSLDLFFKRNFNGKNTIEAQVVGTLSSSDYRRTNSYRYADGTADDYVMDVDSRRRSLISEVCYSHEFSGRTSLSAGYQNTLSRSTNTYLTSDYKPVLTENNNYVYVRLGQQIGNVYLSAATGAKLFWIKNDMNKRRFVRNLSSAQLSWNIGSHWNIRGAFSYSPSIPSLTSLTDYPQQQTPYLISNGNPDLKVPENFTYQFSATYRTGKFSVSYMSAIANTSNSLVDDVTYIGDRMFLSQSVNGRYRHVYQNDLTMKLSEIHGFGANLYLSLMHYATAGQTWKHHLTSFDASMSLWWSKGPFTVSYWRKLPGKYLNGHYVGKDENGDALSLEYTPDKHWTIGVDWMYMFDKKGTRYPAWNYSAVNPSYRERYIKNNGNMIVLSATYSADFGSIFRSSRRSLNNSDNGTSLLKL